VACIRQDKTPASADFQYFVETHTFIQCLNFSEATWPWTSGSMSRKIPELEDEGDDEPLRGFKVRLIRSSLLPFLCSQAL
jgi:hypothetical protein